MYVYEIYTYIYLFIYRGVISPAEERPTATALQRAAAALSHSARFPRPKPFPPTAPSDPPPKAQRRKKLKKSGTASAARRSVRLARGA